MTINIKLYKNFLILLLNFKRDGYSSYMLFKIHKVIQRAKMSSNSEFEEMPQVQRKNNFFKSETAKDFVYFLFKTTCPNINISLLVYCVSGRQTVFNRFLEIFAKDMALLVQKWPKSVSGYSKTKRKIFYH